MFVKLQIYIFMFDSVQFKLFIPEKRGSFSFVFMFTFSFMKIFLVGVQIDWRFLFEKRPFWTDYHHISLCTFYNPRWNECKTVNWLMNKINKTYRWIFSEVIVQLNLYYLQNLSWNWIWLNLQNNRIVTGTLILFNQNN